MTAAGISGFINVRSTFLPSGISSKPFTDLSNTLSFIESAKSHPEAIKDLYYCLSFAGEDQAPRAR